MAVTLLQPFMDRLVDDNKDTKTKVKTLDTDYNAAKVLTYSSGAERAESFRSNSKDTNNAPVNKALVNHLIAEAIDTNPNLVNKKSFNFSGKTRTDIYNEFRNFPNGTIFILGNVDISSSNTFERDGLKPTVTQYHGAIAWKQASEHGNDFDITIFAAGDLFNVIAKNGDSSIQIFDLGSGTRNQALLTNKDVVAFYKDQIIEFNTIKTGTFFEDSSKFWRYVMEDGQAVVGGHDGSVTSGEVISHSHTRRGLRHGIDPGGSTWDAELFMVGTNQAQTNTGSTGGSYNRAWGRRLIKVVYVAKRDIMNNELVGNVPSGTGGIDPAVRTLIDTKIAAALSENMHVEFTDSSTDDYKIGD